MKYLFISLILLSGVCRGQQGFPYLRISTDDGVGLSSNVITSLYQDGRGFIWVGTANGLQRFDGSKFIQFKRHGNAGQAMPHTAISQIIPTDSGKLILSMPGIREFGIFNPVNFEYTRIDIKVSRPIPARADFYLWKLANGDLLLNVTHYGILRYNAKQRVFEDDNTFDIPSNWPVSLNAVYEDKLKQQYWFGGDSGICIYDKPTRQLWNKHNNPRDLPLLKDTALQSRVTQLYIDKARRVWVFRRPAWSNGIQVKYCLDSAGNPLKKDTAGLNEGTTNYTECNYFYETKEGDLWIYGMDVLYNYDNNAHRFIFNKSVGLNNTYGVNYEMVNQVMEDRDGSTWIASDKGLYFAPHTTGSISVANLIFNSGKELTYLTDIIEMPNGDFWFASWGSGIKTLDSFFKKTPNYIYQQPPANWTASMKATTKLTWSMCRSALTGEVWIGCNEGILLEHDPVKRTTKYLQPPEFNKSSIRTIATDVAGNMWFGTQGGRVIKWSNRQFTVVEDIGTTIYKIFFDKQGWMWLATHEKGLYAIDPSSGRTLQHYTAGQGSNKLYGNTGSDIEQLNDSVIVYGAGALNFVNKRTGTVRIFDYDMGLPSNSVSRLRVDKRGFLWIITSNGLCSNNPGNNRITTYGRKDGIVMGDQTTATDFQCSRGYIMFGGGNAVVMFNPSLYLNNMPPPDVTITDFKIFNQYISVDSLLQNPEIQLKPDENSFSIYFSALSYIQRDKLTYYYKMEGIDKEWIRADRWYYENYSLLPPGRYTFKVYCENIEGIRSPHISEMHIYIKPPFYRTRWFYCTILFGVALIIYAVHSARIRRLLDVEKLRNRVARDLHDDMGSTLSTINILTSMAKTKMNTDTVKTSEYLGKISDNSQRMMEAMDDIVWSIKPSNDSMQKITARMREFATNVLEAKEIELVFTVAPEVYDVKLNMEARRDFFLVFKEAVNNAAKYSKATTVWVNLSLKNQKLCLVVKDDGIGFDVSKADGGNGLGNIQKRVDAMNGKVVIQSKEGEGTEARISIPVA